VGAAGGDAVVVHAAQRDDVGAPVPAGRDPGHLAGDGGGMLALMRKVLWGS
jgi:hypothetical protein